MIENFTSVCLIGTAAGVIFLIIGGLLNFVNYVSKGKLIDSIINLLKE